MAAAGSGGTTATGSAGMDAASEPTPTCSSDARDLAPGTTRETIEVGGVSRTFWLIVPSAYDASKPVPLVLELHGLGLDGGGHALPQGRWRT